MTTHTQSALAWIREAVTPADLVMAGEAIKELRLSGDDRDRVERAYRGRMKRLGQRKSA